MKQAGAGAHQVERGKDLSSAGIAYAKATAAVIDLAVNASIDASSHKLGSVVARKAKDDGEAEARTQSLKERNAELIAQAQSYAAIKQSVGGVEAHFAGLQQLAGAMPGDAAAAATKNLADRVNSTSVALGGEAMQARPGIGTGVCGGTRIAPSSHTAPRGQQEPRP